jgi:hypothetical protein
MTLFVLWFNTKLKIHRVKMKRKINKKLIRRNFDVKKGIIP